MGRILFRPDSRGLGQGLKSFFWGDLADGIKFNLMIKRSFVFIDECFTRCIGKGYKSSVLILVSIFKNNDCLCYWRECRSVIFQLITRVVLTRLCTMIFDSSR